ncbi:hypothetical protein HYH02_008423 [Chlamydomonas schloesseri]|uniref:Uncharacterized protein n=1 Tax=Chlamydomonas schloesseri TaxID=2026947 RepID=A0A835WFU2_9CHLO|nr:hypothetical protein HYH02_008423 [Chlamydomonas schloesseri]|eukprot:KAG2446431.1 hypothetical protein HYH02_008423 [Chlamydomonas schloesseri]
MAATGGLGGIGGPAPAGALRTTTAGEGPGRPISSSTEGERTFSSEGGPQYGGRQQQQQQQEEGTPPSDMGPFPGTTSAIGGMGGDLEGGRGGKGFGMPGTGGEGPPAATRPGRANADVSAGESSYIA